jgi:alpha-1,2-mannosyltransferase
VQASWLRDPLEGCPIFAPAELIRAKNERMALRRRRRRDWLALTLALAFFAVAIYAYIVDVRSHPLAEMLSWFDLRVYNDGGLIALHSPARLYSWQLIPGIKFTYTPFAALLFAATSQLGWHVLTWSMTVLSLIALPLVAWLTFGALGWRGTRRGAAALALAGVALWTEPVQRALDLGQIELVLMLLIVADLCQRDKRWWKGAGIGVAAGIKLVPLIFIPYLLLSGKIRQALVATASFAATIVIGFVFLPSDSVHYWLTGYFLHPRNTGSVGALVNQSLLAALTRYFGTEAAATGTWLVLSVVIGVVGVTAAAWLHRGGKPVQGWVLCALTGLLVSPISWDHHWVWVLPMLVVAVDWAVAARGAIVRWARLLLPAAIAAIFLAWPGDWSGTWAYVPQGLLGFFDTEQRIFRINSIRRRPAITGHQAGIFHQLIYRYLSGISVQRVYHLHGIALISRNLFTLAGLALLVWMLYGAVAARRAGRVPPAAPGGQHESPAPAGQRARSRPASADAPAHFLRTVTAKLRHRGLEPVGVQQRPERGK